jgi:peptidoglycan/LPS O-acetylase OafA/YrhL
VLIGLALRTCSLAAKNSKVMNEFTKTSERLQQSPLPVTRDPLPILTALRFFAAVEVVVYHEVYAGGHLRGVSAFLRDWTSGGFEAVTFFFVLSGFILTYVYSGPKENSGLNTLARDFWKSRFARIAPAYVLGLVIAFPHFVYSALITKITAISDFVVGLLLVPVLQQAWVPSAAMAWNAPAWSLSIEFFFYASFPTLILVATMFSCNRFVVYAYGLVIGTVLLRHLIISPDAAFGSPAWNFYMFFSSISFAAIYLWHSLGALFYFWSRRSG